MWWRLPTTGGPRPHGEQNRGERKGWLTLTTLTLGAPARLWKPLPEEPPTFLRSENGKIVPDVQRHKGLELLKRELEDGQGGPRNPELKCWSDYRGRMVLPSGGSYRRRVSGVQAGLIPKFRARRAVVVRPKTPGLPVMTIRGEEFLRGGFG